MNKVSALLAFGLGVAAIALVVPAHATEIAWHSKSDHSSQHPTSSGFNAERPSTAVFSTGEQASIVGYSTNYKEVNGKRPWTGISLIRFDDLSSIAIKSEGTFDPLSHENNTAGQFIYGTGRFEGITGNVTCLGKYITHQLLETDCTGSYSLPGKQR